MPDHHTLNLGEGNPILDREAKVSPGTFVNTSANVFWHFITRGFSFPCRFQDQLLQGFLYCIFKELHSFGLVKRQENVGYLPITKQGKSQYLINIFKRVIDFLTPSKEGMGSRIPSIQERKKALTILADVQFGECQQSLHKVHSLQDIHDRRVC